MQFAYEIYTIATAVFNTFPIHSRLGRREVNASKETRAEALMASRATMARATLLTPYPCRKHAAGPGTGAGLWILCRCAPRGVNRGSCSFLFPFPFPFLFFLPHFQPCFFLLVETTRGPVGLLQIVPLYPSTCIRSDRHSCPTVHAALLFSILHRRSLDARSTF